MSGDSWQLVCEAKALEHAQCREFDLAQDDKIQHSNAFVLNWHGQYFAYLNSCPHTGVSMNWAPDQFLDPDDQFLYCGLHGAIFEPSNGLCVRGPCIGQSLKSLPLENKNGQIWVKIA